MIKALTALALGIAMSVTDSPAPTGTASWYDDGPGFYAAVPSFHFGDQPYRLLVSLADGSRAVVVTVRDHCACYVGTPRERLIDLSPEAFAGLADRTAGLITVTIEPVASPTPPPTDVEPPGAPTTARGDRLLPL